MPLVYPPVRRLCMDTMQGALPPASLVPSLVK
jgi:hypothetical protein